MLEFVVAVLELSRNRVNQTFPNNREDLNELTGETLAKDRLFPTIFWLLINLHFTPTLKGIVKY